jgi:hypothetical protein
MTAMGNVPETVEESRITFNEVFPASSLLFFFLNSGKYGHEGKQDAEDLIHH